MYVVLLPLLFVVAMSVFEPVPMRDWRRRFVELGWDLCVLSFGVIGAVASLAIARDGASSQAVLTETLLAVGLAFVCVGLIGKAKPLPHPLGWQGIGALALGAVSLLFPTVLGLMRGSLS